MRLSFQGYNLMVNVIYSVLTTLGFAVTEQRVDIPTGAIICPSYELAALLVEKQTFPPGCSRIAVELKHQEVLEDGNPILKVKLSDGRRHKVRYLVQSPIEIQR